ncbi:helix-turn-helix domain-containing protein [Pseudotamlana carrageenivorans]|uniref:XRE family transcriptional regulator n=1 Tax=Pseudotamlana carrageenivorans TaxID=2069432 RepID=A0A2I7SLC9_9FLAO|nr:helix-turn-helix transcriptional regulator [Tamlana carrageenivorans]AUS06725.1 XRE family transcriptional regulator [Tamlana carrageenivorans]
MNNSIGYRIKKVRENKGISQEAMALELDITQSNYGRLEKSDNRLTIPKIQKIAKVLDITISYLFDEKSEKIINQHNNENVQAYNVETIINADKEHITSLKEEIAYLRELLKKEK